MNILERIRKYLDSEGAYPWGLGFDKNSDSASKEVLVAWGLLSIEEKLAISKNNPFIAERKKYLLKLRRQGFSQPVLIELSGLSMGTIKRILLKKETKNG
jgi:hypothetical protein